MASEYTTEFLEEVVAKQSCPFCHVRAGQKCVGDGRLGKTHRGRIKKYQARLDNLELQKQQPNPPTLTDGMGEAAKAKAAGATTSNIIGGEVMKPETIKDSEILNEGDE